MEENKGVFSKRLGFAVDTYRLQTDFMDTPLRKGLWYVFSTKILSTLRPRHQFGGVIDQSNLELYVRDFYRRFLGEYPVDVYPDLESYIEVIEDTFFRSEWYVPYDMIEHALSNQYFDYIPIQTAFNKILQDERSAYRLIEKIFCPVTAELELTSIQNAIESVGQRSILAGASVHLKAALEYLSNKENPDYRNSIKESISAVEVVFRAATGESTLGGALAKIQHKSKDLNKQLLEGLNKLYNYTNDKQSGIRHAIVDAHEPPDIHTAQFFLVTCSAFINYLLPLTEDLLNNKL